MKKKLSILICSLLLSVSLVGCGSESNNGKYEILGNRTYLIIDYTALDNISHKILVDTETKVQYLYITNGHAGGMSVLVDAEGKPILYEGDLEVE